MPKQTKTVKFMLAVLLLIPIVLFVVAIAQTFIIKSKQAELSKVQYELAQAKQNEQDLQGELDYKTSDEYLNEYYKHHYGYSENDDIIVK